MLSGRSVSYVRTPPASLCLAKTPSGRHEDPVREF